MREALITGASRGIGREIANTLARNGYSLHLICEKNVTELINFSSELSKKYNVTVVPHQADVADFEAMSGIFKDIDDLDVLVNNAGISYVGLLHEMSVESWKRVIDVNLTSVFNTCKLAIPIMLKKHSGSIINISSVFGANGASMEVAYSASKGGINAFTKALGRELAPSTISVNAIACGFVDTDMNNNLSDEEKEAIRAEIPADRFASPTDIANAVMMLLSSPNYLTGQVITVDGGWT